MKTVLIVGGTGAQGAAVVRHLASTNEYNLIVLTRDVTSSRAAALGELPHVELVATEAAHAYNLDVFDAAAARSDYVLVNTDGFALGEQAETYWGIVLYERSVRAGVKHFVYSGLDNIGRQSGYAPHLHVGHYEGKARVQDYLRAQPISPTAWTIIRSGPYMEMLSEALAPAVDDKGAYTYNLPLDNGAIDFIHLGDFGRYVHWVYSHPDESTGLDLGIATVHASGQDIATAFANHSGNNVSYRNIPASAWTAKAFANLAQGDETKVGSHPGQDERILNQTFKQNFTNWWNLYKASGGNVGLIRRDYELLDRILPDRVKSVQEWMEKVGYTGERKLLLKSNDRYVESATSKA